MLSRTNWLDILDGSDDGDIGKLIVRLARQAERAHVEASPPSDDPIDSTRKDRAQAEGLGLRAVTPRSEGASRRGVVRKEAGR